MSDNVDLLKAMGIDPSIQHVTWPPLTSHRKSNEFLRQMMTEHGIKTLDMLNMGGIGADDNERIDHILSSYPSDIDFNLSLIEEQEQEQEQIHKERRSMSQDSIKSARNIFKTMKNLFHSRKTR